MTDRMEELLDEVAAYANRLADSDKLADTGSMAAAEALAELYEKREWIEKWQEIKPAKADALGRKDPASRSRFAGWLVWAEEQRGKSAPVPRRTHQLLTAYDIVGLLPAGTVVPTVERTVRPLAWLVKAKYAERVPELWRRAVELADGASVTEGHVQQARREFRATLTPAQDRAAIATQRAHTHRLKAQTAVEVLWADRDLNEAEAFKQWFLHFLQEKARAVA